LIEVPSNGSEQFGFVLLDFKGADRCYDITAPDPAARDNIDTVNVDRVWNGDLELLGSNCAGAFEEQYEAKKMPAQEEGKPKKSEKLDQSYRPAARGPAILNGVRNVGVKPVFIQKPIRPFRRVPA